MRAGERSARRRDAISQKDERCDVKWAGRERMSRSKVRSPVGCHSLYIIPPRAAGPRLVNVPSSFLGRISQT